MPDWLATTLGVFAGGALSMLAAFLGDRRLAQRDRERRREELRERLLTRRADLQRVDLQVASQGLLRSVGAVLYQDLLAQRTTGIWQKQQLPDALSEEQLRLTTEVILLASRVRDDDVRSLTDLLRTEAQAVLFSSSEEEAQTCMSAASKTQTALILRIGKLVREQDERMEPMVRSQQAIAID